MDSNNLLKYIFCLLLIFINCGHDNCFRDYSGNIKFASNSEDITIVIKKHNYFYSEWFELDSLKIGKNQNSYNIEWAEQRPQRSCNNGCPDGNSSMSDSIRVTILKTFDRRIMKDTVFSCEDYTFNGDDIELPTITLP